MCLLRNSLALWAVLFLAWPVLAVPPLPTINTNNVVVITNAPYSALGDGMTDNTLAISNAIVTAAKGGKTNGLWGGTVEIPAPGVYLCGPEVLRNNLNLQIDAEAILRLLPYSSYPGGITSPPDFITGTSLTNIEMSGAGTIDGQGTPWWPGYETNNRPTLVVLSRCSFVLFQNFTLSNAPAQNISIKGNGAGNVTIQGIVEMAPDSSIGSPPSHNTDGIDLAETNCLIQNCNISVGDDNVALGSSSGLSRDIIITNCAFGFGHGVSLGSYTSSGVSNLTVIGCTFNRTQNGIRLKSDDGRGGVSQNLSYLNLGMTNVNMPLQIYSYYEEVGTPNSISPQAAAAETVESASSSTPVWRNIMVSNVTATAQSGFPAVLIWSRTELPVTNLILDKCNITAAEPVEIYNASGVQVIDSQFTLPPGISSFELFNARITVTNTAPGTNVVTFDGVGSTGYPNQVALYNATGAVANTNVLFDCPLSLGDALLTVSNNFTLAPTSVLNYTLGTNAATVAVTGQLTLGGTINLRAGLGFTNGVYTLLTSGGGLAGPLPSLAATPSGYNCTLSTNLAGLVQLQAALPPPGAPTNFIATPGNLMIQLDWNAVPGAATYNLKRGTGSNGPYPTVFSGLVGTNYTDTAVTNGATYYYVVTTVGAGGESTNSAQASAAPLPSLVPPDIAVQWANGQWELSWPSQNLGWSLEIQTNSWAAGLGTNWVMISGSQTTTQFSLPYSPANGSVFLRLVY